MVKNYNLKDTDGSEGFKVRTSRGLIIIFDLYAREAPATSDAFLNSLPFSAVFDHAKISGQEIWSGNCPPFNISQENSSLFALPGEIALGPIQPARNKITGLMGIFYGTGQLMDSGNIFGCNTKADRDKLSELGNTIWTTGSQELHFEKI